MINSVELEKVFLKLKEMLEDRQDLRVEVNGFYFNKKVVNLLEQVNRRFFLNNSYDLTISDILGMIEDNRSVEEVRENLFSEYKTIFATGWYENFVEVLENVYHLTEMEINI